MRLSKTKFRKRAVVYVLTSATLFTVSVLALSAFDHSVPDALIYGFFAFLGTEAGILSFIKNSDNKYNKNDNGGLG